MPAGSNTQFLVSTISIGLTDKPVNIDMLPGWEAGSIGYHSDDGNAFDGQPYGNKYGPKFGAGDVVGCGVSSAPFRGYYTKNGRHLGRGKTKQIHCQACAEACRVLPDLGDALEYSVSSCWIDGNWRQSKGKFWGSSFSI